MTNQIALDTTDRTKQLTGLFAGLILSLLIWSLCDLEPGDPIVTRRSGSRSSLLQPYYFSVHWRVHNGPGYAALESSPADCFSNITFIF